MYFGNTNIYMYLGNTNIYMYLGNTLYTCNDNGL